MAAVRPPLNSRMPVSMASPQKPPRTSLGSKRARSPEPPAEGSNSKRPRAVPPSPTLALAARDEASKDKERKRLERDAQKMEFKVKYTRAFPTWTFYFDLPQHDPESALIRAALEARVTHVGGRIEDFFSSDVTHLISNKPIPPEEPPAEKENQARARTKSGTLLKSPIKLRGRAAEEPPSASSCDTLIAKALQFQMKIWTGAKLESVLDRCSVPLIAVPSASTSRTTAASTNNLRHMLQSERIHGTSERDPREKRHDYRYFSRGSHFVLVEDIKGELATVAALEYSVGKPSERPSWPVLHCHPNARGPFIAYDDRERRRYERSLHAEAQKEQEAERKRTQKIREEEKRRIMQKKEQAHGDLRRSVSMNNIRRSSMGGGPPGTSLVDLDDFCDNQESANASGYLASAGGYMAASGNSVGITSTTGTTSAAGTSRRESLPTNLRNSKLFTTSIRASVSVESKTQGKQRVGTMGPPTAIPERALRKSKSMNTVKLEKREEGKKPGYCESCRQKFEDFKLHIIGRKHRKFALNDDNFLQLDYTLSRVERRTREQVAEDERQRSAMRERRAQYGSDDYEEGEDVQEETEDGTVHQGVWNTDVDTDMGQPEEEEEEL